MENAPMRRAIPILQHLFLLYFLFMTLYALIFTMTRVQYFPFIPWTVLRFHYGMMAPYQGISATNADLLAEGLREGSWHRIDLDPYYSMVRGSQVMYRRMRSFSFLEPEVYQQKYSELAKKFLRLEAERGEEYESIEFYAGSMHAHERAHRFPLLRLRDEHVVPPHGNFL